MKHIKYLIEKYYRIAMILAMLVFVVFACEERFMPEINNKYNEVLVVDGMITSGSGPFVIKLSSSTTLDQPIRNPVSGYGVKLEDDLGNTEVCVEGEPGIYSSSLDGMQGIPGRMYKLVMHSPNGKIYESDFEKILEPVAIESVYPEVEYTPIDTYPYDLPGYQFYLDAGSPSNDSSYFMWYLQETYRYESDYKIYFSYYDRIVHPVKNKDSLKVCWLTDKVNGFYLMNTASLSSPEISHFPLHYVPTDDRRLSVRYSLLTEQFTITAKAYNYWKSTIEQNTENGELFTKQLYQVRGNIHNINDNDESVFGYFFAAGLTENRIFVDRPQYPVEMYYSKCVLNRTDYEMYGWMFYGPGPPANNPTFVTEDVYGVRALPGQECMNCLLKGGTTDKPDFWIDN